MYNYRLLFITAYYYFINKSYQQSYNIYNKIVKLSKTNDNVYYNMACCLYHLNKLDTSLYFFNKIENKNINNNLLTNIAIIYLKKNNLRQGLILYEYRLYNESFYKDNINFYKINIPIWDGIKSCNKLIIYGEQGLGDQLQFYRYILMLRKRYRNMIIYCIMSDKIKHIIKNKKRIYLIKKDKVVADYKLLMISLLKILNIYEIVPFNNKYNYLINNKLKNTYWKKIIKSYRKPIIGIYWKSNNIYKNIDKNIPINELLNLFTSNNIFISLDTNKYNCLPTNVLQFNIDKDKSFIDTIAIINNVDILVTIDSVVAHIGGIIGKKTYLLLENNNTDWRWFQCNNCKWYTNIYIFRKEDTWKELFNLIKNKIKI